MARPISIAAARAHARHLKKVRDMKVGKGKMRAGQPKADLTYDQQSRVEAERAKTNYGWHNDLNEREMFDGSAGSNERQRSRNSIRRKK